MRGEVAGSRAKGMTAAVCRGWDRRRQIKLQRKQDGSREAPPRTIAAR